MNITFFEHAWEFHATIETRPESETAWLVLDWRSEVREAHRHQHPMDMATFRHRPQAIELVVNSVMLEALHDIASHYDLSSQELMQEQPESTNRLRDFLTSAIRPREPLVPPTRDINEVLRENAHVLGGAHGIERRPLGRNPFNAVEADRRMWEAANVQPVAQLTTAQLDEAYRRLQELSGMSATVREDVRRNIEGQRAEPPMLILDEAAERLLVPIPDGMQMATTRRRAEAEEIPF